MDAIPVLSQLKSIIQLIFGDNVGAARTQENFLKQCPVVSQIQSLIQAAGGDLDGARETQEEFAHAMGDLVNSVPVVGHVKGVIHYACGDSEGGGEAMKASSRSVGVIAGSAGGFLVAGPAGAAAGAISAGAAADSVITIGDLIVNGKNVKPYGIIGNIFKLTHNPKDVGTYVDLFGGVALDGLAGAAAGEGLGEKINYKIKKNRLDRAVGRKGASHIVDAGESMREIRSRIKIKPNKPHILTVTKDTVINENYKGHNKQIRSAIRDNAHMTPGPTELQIRVPNAKKILKRNPNTCAEQQAYNGAYKNRPAAEPRDLRSATVRWHNEGPVSVPGCDNCQQFKPAMGEVVNDLLPDSTSIPARVPASRVAGLTSGGIVLHGLHKQSEEEVRAIITHVLENHVHIDNALKQAFRW